MKFFTKRIPLFLLALVTFFTLSVSGQSVLNPNDSIVTYNASAPAGSLTNPNYPDANTITKWIRTVRLTWNTNEWKAYILHTIPFRLKYPKSYDPNANDGKKYPMLIFWHGAGEKGPATDNEFSLANGGPVFQSAVDNGTFDGYVLVFQSPGNGWSGPNFDLAVQVANYMVTNNKLDPFRIITNGLSAGGYASWGMLEAYPQYTAAALPMSGITLGDSTAAVRPLVKFTPLWDFQGGLDTGPDPNTAQQVVSGLNAAGANIKYTLYPQLGHGTWTTAWAEPDFFPFCNRAYMSNPWTLFGRTQFCPGDPINVTIGVAPKQDAYQWRKDGVLLSAITNSITATTTGTYDCRVQRNGIWSDWSHIPVVISIKAPTVTPPITVSGLMSKVIPALNNPGVTLKVPSGYVSYLWQKTGDTTTRSTDSTLKVTTPGNYIVRVTELYGCSSSFSAPFTVIDSAGPNRPDPASGLTVTVLSQTSMELDWSQNPSPNYNETNFEIYQSTQPGGPYTMAAITGADVTTQVITGLQTNTKYYYIVRAVNNTAASILSGQASGTTTADTQAPTVPGSLLLTGSTKTSISLSWTASTDNIGVTQYYIYINGVKTYSTKQTNFTVDGLQTGQNYIFTVQAADQAKNLSSMSNQVSGQAKLIGLNYNFYTFTANWNTLADFGTLTPALSGVMPNVSIASATQTTNYAYLWQGYIRVPVTGSYTFQTSSDDGSKLWLGALNQTASPYTYSGMATVNNDGQHGTTSVNSSTLTLTAGTYPIAIAFFQQGGGYTMSVGWKTPQTAGNFVAIPDSVFADKTAAAGVAPAIPTTVKATATAYNKIGLTWTDNTNNETGFEIYRSTSSVGAYSIVTTAPANATGFTDTTVLPSTTYFYKIQAVNQYGASGYDPSSLGGVAYSFYQGTWNNLPPFNSLTPVSTGNLNNISLSPSPVTTNFAFKFLGTINIPATGSYTFYTASDDGSNLYVGGFDSAHLVVKNDYLQGTTERSGTLTLTKGSYPIYVTYFQQGGGYVLTTSYQGPGISKQLIPDSAFINKNSSATTLGLPAAPINPYNVTAIALSSSVVSLSWADTASGVTGYNIYRSFGDSSRFLLLASLPAAITHYSDTGLYANQTYYYKINAVWVGGNTGYSAAVFAQAKDIAPVITPLPNRNIRYGTTTVVPVSITSASSGGLTLTPSNLPAFASFADNGNGTGVLTFSPVLANQGVYNSIKVKVADPNGGVDSTQFNLTVNGNYTPVIHTLSDTIIHEGDSVRIALSATDSTAGATLTWSVGNLPNNFTLVNGANGYATLVLQPTFAAAGTYAVKLTINDGQGDSSIRSFNLTILDKDPSTKIYARVKYANTIGAPWNSMTGISTPNLLDQNGNTTPVGINFLQSWWMPFNGGPTTGNNSGVYPDAVLNDFWYFGYYGGPETAALSVTGLNPAGKYNLTFYAGSVFNGFPDNGTTVYTVGTQSVSLYVQNNTQKTVSINTLSPDASGNITVNMAKAAGSPIGYLNALVITSLYDDGMAPAAPSLLTALNVAGKGVQLNWHDAAYNETGYEIYRSTGNGGTYNLLTTANTATVSYLDSTISGTTPYFYTVRAINSHGHSAYSDTASVITKDRIPQIAAIADVLLKNNQNTTVTVTATDDPTDHITLKASNLPSFASFTDNGNGTGTVSIQPAAGLLGTFTGLTITATDNSDSSRSASFNLFVVDGNVTSTYVNLTNNDNLAPAPWNNMAIPYLPNAGYVISGLKDDGNNVTGVSVTLTDAWDGVSLTGMRRRNGSEVYPETVERSALYTTSTSAHRITVTGLDPAKQYNFLFYNSDGTSASSLTNFTINGQTSGLNGSYNSNKTAQLNGISSDAGGTVVISCAKDVNAAYGLLSALVIESYTPASVATLSPADLRVLDYAASNTVSLQWQDRSSNETGYQVWRAADGGTYSLLTSLPANSTSYTDAGLSANSSYNYIVRAVNGTNYSTFSNPVRGYTYSPAVFINFASSASAAPAPWNNLNWVYGLGAFWNNFNDETGVPTNIGMVQPVKVDGMVSPGVNTGNNSGIFPDKVMAEGFGMFPGDTTYVVLNGLNLARKYDITVFASLTNYPGENSTVYMVNGQTCLLNSLNNSTGTLTIFGLVPDQNGQIRISFTGYPTATFGLLGAMIVKGYTPSVNPISPAPATAIVTPGAVTATASRFTTTADSTNNSLLNGMRPLTAYPNPFDQDFTLLVPALAGDKVLVTITDVSGIQIYQKRWEGLYQGNNQLRIQPAGQVTTGIYFVTVNYINRNDRQTLKVMKK
ncbi:fibronectin type III domain-containing protein [Flavitalea flava]